MSNRETTKDTDYLEHKALTLREVVLEPKGSGYPITISVIRNTDLGSDSCRAVTAIIREKRFQSGVLAKVPGSRCSVAENFKEETGLKWFEEKLRDFTEYSGGSHTVTDQKSALAFVTVHRAMKAGTEVKEILLAERNGELSIRVANTPDGEPKNRVWESPYPVDAMQKAKACMVTTVWEWRQDSYRPFEMHEDASFLPPNMAEMFEQGNGPGRLKVATLAAVQSEAVDQFMERCGAHG